MMLTIPLFFQGKNIILLFTSGKKIKNREVKKISAVLKEVNNLIL